MSKKHLYLIDATAFCYRAFYALKGLSTSFGQPTNAIYGFVTMLNKILKEKKPEYLAVCFDVSRDTFRQKKFAEYKIQRPPMPDGLSAQIPYIKEIISAYGIALYELKGYEADDIIATLSTKAKSQEVSTTIISSDKDILQLIDDDINIFNPQREDGPIYDAKLVRERFAVRPEDLPDIIALMGDDVDNIPGVPGVGEKTAVELIRNFGSLKKLLNNTDKIKQEKIRQSIEDNLEKINLSRELAVLDKGVDIDFDLEKLKISKPNFKELFRLFNHLEFKKLLKDLPMEEEKGPQLKIEDINDRDLEVWGKTSELFLSGQSKADLVFYAKDKFFKVLEFKDNIKDILASPQVKKVGHNLKKIKVSLAKDNIALEGLYFDTMIAAYLINPSGSDYALGNLAWEFLKVMPQGAPLSNERAVDLILKLKPVLEEELRNKSLFNLFRDIEMPLASVLAEMELNGIKLDLKLLRELSQSLEKRLIKLIEQIYQISGTQFNINSPKQLRDILFERLKLPVVKRSKTGPSTDEEVLRNLAKKHKLPQLLLEYRQLTKLKSTYIDTLPDLIDTNTGRIHTSFNQTVTETGRLSSSNPNLQNIPVKTDIGRKIRQAIITGSPDNCLLSCDYSQIELRILAHLSGDENLITAFKKDRDVHKISASLIYGLEEKDIDDSMRETAKRVNFGIIYGLSAWGLSRDLGIPVDEAQGFIDAYFMRYPKVKVYIEDQIKKAEDNGFVTTILGRRRYIPEINNKNQAIRQFAQRQAANTPIQGSASDLIKLAMIEIHKEIILKESKGKMLIQIHDELVFDLPIDELKGFAHLVKDKMENVLKLDLPVRVNIKKGKNWLEMEDIK